MMRAMDYTPTETVNEDAVQPGRRFGYGLWLQPIINANDRSETVTPDQDAPSSPPRPQRRGRGRPPVKRPRNDSAIEKRRAQVREAQRTYQRRKDAATAHERRRADELLQLLSSLSTDVEALLQAALMAGNMHRDDKVSKTVQRLWSTYDTVVNSDCVKPELRFHQLKNNRRLATHTTSPNLQEDVSSVPQVEPETAVRLRKSPDSFDASAISFDLVRFEETTVMSSFQRTAATDRYMAGKSMFDLVTERQAAMKESDRRKSQSSQSRD